MDFYFTVEFRNYLKNSSANRVVRNPTQTKNVIPAFNTGTKYKKKNSCRGIISLRNAKLGHCTLLFCRGSLRNVQRQEIIKIRERIPHIGSLTKVIPLKLFCTQFFGG